MSSNTHSIATDYTRSVITFLKLNGNQLHSVVGTYVHIDDLGHILSARHIFCPSYEGLESHSFLFDKYYSSFEIVADDEANDLILIRLKDFQKGSIRAFATFLDDSHSELPRGTPLARFGFPLGAPFSNIPFGWNEGISGFEFDAEKTFVTGFKNEGVILGYVDRDPSSRFLETNSPALLGQSGGPIVNQSGLVVGLQSRNSIFEIEVPDRPSVETGLATSHIKIANFLKSHPQVQTIFK